MKFQQEVETSLSFFETRHAPWKLNIVIMMQLWEGNSKGKKILRVKITIFAKQKSSKEYWACIILLIREPNIGLFLKVRSKVDQANKSARGMPWHQEPMKDVISCEKLRGAANKLRSGDIRMGKPTARYHTLNQIGVWGEPPELKHLSRARKRHQPRFRK